MLLLLQLLEQGSIDGAPEILQAMAQTSDRQKIPALLPADATIHHKVGTLSGVEHDVGIVESPEGKRFIVVCMSSGLASNQTGISAIAEASRLVYDTMTQPQAQASSDSDASTPAAQSTPTYSFPVRAAWVEYTPYHHDYPATDIFCPVGSEFLATTNGVVDFVNRVDRWDPTTDRPADRGGIMLAIVGDDGWRYYASHLSGIAEGIEPGVRVTTGQLLGWTGRSGNARHTDPHVHYGISHPTTPEDWQVRRGEIPPYEYLQAWARGEHKTPGR
jgi:murein DD-endopeptidase MepM/ murein hydrolase activator NlpD